MRSREDLPTIPSDPAMYSVNPTLDANAAATSAAQQFLVRAGVSGGGMKALQLLAQGNYLGAFAVGGATLTMDSLNRYYNGQHFSTPYSQRKGAQMGDILFDNGGSPALAAERAMNSLESTSMGERTGSSVVSAFSNSVKNFRTGISQINQENRALQNYLRDAGPLVVPH